jgi:tol-pal system protein YbgF
MGAKAFSKWMALLVAVLLTGGGCALQDDIVIVDRRLAALQQKVAKQEKQTEALRSEISRYHEKQADSDEASRNKYADLSVLVNDLREEIQILRGKLEEVGHSTHQKMGTMADSESKRQDRWKELERSMQAGLDRIVRLEAYLGMEPSEKMALRGPRSVGSGKEVVAKKTPDAQYAQAKEKFDRGEYEASRGLFQAFLKDHPKSENADNAQFWVGEVYYREKWYEKAILEYQKVIEKYPKGNKVRSALLKQGFAFFNLGDKDNARLILKELVRKYPDSSEAKIAKDKLDKLS